MARKSRVKYTLTSNTVTRTWAAVRLLHTLLTSEFQLIAPTVVLGLFGGVRCVELIRAEHLTE